MSETEHRILWATADEAASGSLVLAAAGDLGFAAQICSPREIFDILKPSRFDLVGVEIARDARDGINVVRQIHERFPRVTIVAAITDSGVGTLRAALEAG